ncbi:hypothetical protein [Pararhodonellum marinum]|uniref:hypothetical protein n=1 Tax=Pararhodonellum marinum TaxID=2755358 RepID=UPI0018906E3B|nr:hypothetical protein [Pararhodonellum marinum]
MEKIKQYFFTCCLGLWGLYAQSQQTSMPTYHDIFEDSLELTLFTQHQDNPFLLLQSVNPQQNLQANKWEKLLVKLDRQFEKKRSNEKFLRKVFYNTQRILLVEYEIHSDFSGMLKNGVFDCVSGSAAFALLLERYGYDFKLIETDYHVFLLAYSGKQTYVFESTDSLKGFKADQKNVEAFIASMLPTENNIDDLDLNRRLSKLETNHANKKLFQTVDFQELAGLQYYNDAIDQFNQKSYKKAYYQLIKAAHLYPSERIIRLKNLMGQLNP